MRHRRKQLGLSSAQLARVIEESENRIGDWERGDHEPRSRSVVKIAQALGLSADYLLDLTDQAAGTDPAGE